MTLVQPPGTLGLYPYPVGDVERNLGSLDRPAEYGGVHHIRQQIVLHKQLATAGGLGLPLRAQADIYPAGEQVLGVPLTLAVPQEDQGSCHGCEPSVKPLCPPHPHQLFGRSPGSRWLKAARLAVDSPRERRQAHSLRMLSANPSSKIRLKLSSAASATAPRSRSTAARVTSSTGS